MKPIREINEPDFEMEVLNSKQIVLVNFWAAWSQPCRVLGSVLDQVAAGCNGSAKVVKVNVDHNPDLGMWYGIQAVPTLLCFINGKVGAKIVGTASKEAIFAKLGSLAYENKPTTNITVKEITQVSKPVHSQEHHTGG